VSLEIKSNSWTRISIILEEIFTAIVVQETWRSLAWQRIALNQQPKHFAHRSRMSFRLFVFVIL
jgi:hypothetical protein